MTDAVTHMYLVRHGATVANEHRPRMLQGCGVDHELSPTGRGQAAAVAAFFANRPPDAIYSSGMRRAVETAAHIGEATGVVPSAIERLHEVDVGRWEGLHWGLIRNEHPDDYARFTTDPSVHGYPGGESYRDVLDRVRPEFDALLERHTGQTILVVAHSVVNRVYLAHLLGLPISAATGLRQENTGVNVVKRKDGETYVVTMNAFFHLENGE